MKLSASDVDRVLPTQDTSQNGANATKVDLTANLTAVTLVSTDGEIQYQFSSADNYVYTRNSNAIIAPFTADIELQITSIIDSDGVTAKDFDSDLSNGVLVLEPAGEEIRFGR